MKMSRLLWMMILTVLLGFSMTGVAAAQGPPPGADPVNCNGCVGSTDIANGAVTATKVADGAIGPSKISPGAVGSGQINSAQVQRRVAGSCPAGSSIAAIAENGTVLCESGSGGVAAITASAPLVSSGGSTPNIALPGVILAIDNTAVGNGALSNSTGIFNTATGVNALYSNTTGLHNTAVGNRALLSNSAGDSNTASGSWALNLNGTGSGNTATGNVALGQNTSGSFNTATGNSALLYNSTGNLNTGIGMGALLSNTTGNSNTAIGYGADVSAGNFENATAIGAGAIVDASNKIRLGNSAVTVIAAQVGLTVVSDATQKENFQPVDGEATLDKIQGLTLTSWNLIRQDPKRFRHYGPTAQEFFAAFGSDALGTIGTPTTITSTDMDGILMIAVQALEKRTAEQSDRAALLEAENVALKARLEALERLITEGLPQR